MGPLRPRVKESAGRKKGSGSIDHGDRYLARALGEAAVGASKTKTFLGERYRRIARRRGKKKAIVAVARSILVIVWHLLGDDTARFNDLGPGYYNSRINPERKKCNHIRELEASATRSHSNPPPDPPRHYTAPLQPIPAPLRRDAVACPLTIHFRTSRPVVLAPSRGEDDSAFAVSCGRSR